MFNPINEIPIPTPEELKNEISLDSNLKKVKDEIDNELKGIFEGTVDKFLLIIGPCSADNEDAVIEYVTKLAAVRDKVKDKLLIIPRIYTNKPRTTGTGYKGMLHQPKPDKNPDICEGIRAIRRLQVRAIRESGMTAADEMLYPENFAYVEDLLSYHAIGARSVENQLHRLVSSGVDSPVGMKNPTSGDLTVMFNSIIAAQASHIFMYRNNAVETKGNPLAHAILRGYVNKQGVNMQNYHYEDLINAYELYEKSNLKNPAVIVDINHSNSKKIYSEQPRIAKEIMHSRRYDSKLKNMIKGLMIESYLENGSQNISEGIYGKSITDPCLGFKESERLIYEIAETLT